MQLSLGLRHGCDGKTKVECFVSAQTGSGNKDAALPAG